MDICWKVLHVHIPVIFKYHVHTNNIVLKTEMGRGLLLIQWWVLCKCSNKLVRKVIRRMYNTVGFCFCRSEFGISLTAKFPFK